MGGLSDYERQAIESHPCPGCGAYTLSCAAPRTSTRVRRSNTQRRTDGTSA